MTTEPKVAAAAVPAHVHSMIVGGGCGEAHVPNAKGEITCKVCAPLIASHHFAPAPEGFVQPEDADAKASATKSKKSAPADDAAPSA